MLAPPRRSAFHTNTMVDRSIIVDDSALLSLRCGANGATWCWSDAADSAPPKKQRASRADLTRREIETAAIEDFQSTMGGESVPDGGREVARAWCAALMRRRVALVIRGARNMLSGKADDDDDDDDTRVLSRKKDAPDHGDRAGVERFLGAQAEQASLVKRRCALPEKKQRQRAQRVVAKASQPLPIAQQPDGGGGGRRCSCWDAPEEGCSTYAYGLPGGGGGGGARHPRRRAVVDDLVSARECTHAIGAAIYGMDGAHDFDAPEYNGESTLTISPLSVLPPYLGHGAARLVSLLLWRIVGALRDAFGEERPLYVAGALFSRLQPPPRGAAALAAASSGHSYNYDVPHVDKANVASYDYSAVLYLNSKGEGFKGGDFHFIDEHGEEVVEPRVGRCVLFPSGFEQLHRVCTVTHGSRFALAAWFTLTASAAEGPVTPAPYALGDGLVPPPSKDEVEAEKFSLDELRARVESQL